MIRRGKNNEYLFKNIVKWQEIKRDDIKFFKFLKEVVGLLSQDQLPDPGHNCSHCKYIEDNKHFKLNKFTEAEIILN